MNRNGAPGRHITFRSETPHGAKINCKGKDYGFLIFGNYIKLDGFEVYGAARSGITGSAVHHIEVTNNVSHNNAGAGVYFGKSEFLLVDGNVVYENAANAVTSGISIHIPQNVSGDTTTPGFRVVVRNNIAHHNLTVTAGHTDGNGIIFDEWLQRNSIVKTGKPLPGLKQYRYPGLIENNLTYQNGATGIRVYATDNITIRNNTAWHNCTDLAEHRVNSTWNGELQNTSGSNNTWVNNIAIAIANPKLKSYAGIAFVDFKDMPSKNVVWANNLTYTDGKPDDDSVNTNEGNTVPASNNKLGVNPKFVNAPSNFQLVDGSPAVNGGTSKYGAASTDLADADRVVGTIDIGAYENQ